MSITTQITTNQLNDAHRRVLDALVAGDLATLDRLVADDCRIVGPKGFLIGKQEWIESHSGEVYEQIQLEVDHTETTLRDDLAVRCDTQRSECLFRGERISGLFRVLNVWAWSGAGWQLVAIQYTAIAPEAG